MHRSPPEYPNSDNPDLGVLALPNMIIGGVDKVNGRGSEVFPEFNLTRHELCEIARLWATELIESEVFCFLYNSVGSYDIRIVPYALRRIDRIAEALGDDETKEVVDQVNDKKRREILAHPKLGEVRSHVWDLQEKPTKSE